MQPKNPLGANLKGMGANENDRYRDDTSKDQPNPNVDEEPRHEELEERPRGLSDELVDGATVDLDADPGKPGSVGKGDCPKSLPKPLGSTKPSK